jgi:hypothetical protein
MKKNRKKLQLSRETLTTLELEQSLLAAGYHGSIVWQPQLPATSDSVKICCA